MREEVLDKKDEAKRDDCSRGFVSGSERARHRLSTSGGYPDMTPPALFKELFPIRRASPFLPISTSHQL